MNPRLAYVALVTTLLCASANAQNYSCKLNNQTRTISVVYVSPPAKIPCKVNYQKDERTVTLWRADNNQGYCEAKAAAFVKKQKDWGWDCLKMP